MEQQKINKLKEILSIKNRTRYFVWMLFFFSLSSIVIFALLLNRGEARQASAANEADANSFAGTNLEAKSSFVWDVVNKSEMFSKNADLALPLASLTKIMTVITANKILAPSDLITITKEHLTPEGDSELIVGDNWTAKDLTDFTLLTSSNDGAYALASAAGDHVGFIKSMNGMASLIGLANSKFWNEHGLDRETDRGGAYGSARDMAILFEFALKAFPDLMEATRYKNLNFVSAVANYNASNTNLFIDQIPGLIASKTGFTDLAGGNLVIAFDAGLQRPIIISVLGSTQEGRFKDALQLVEATMKYINDN